MTHTPPFKPLKYNPQSDKWKAKKLNNDTFLDYFYRLQELAINMFKWEGLPETVDERFLELTLCEYGQAVYFNDPIIGDLALTCMASGDLDVYRVPIYRRAYANNGYQKDLTKADSVLIYNNYLRQPTIMTIILFARRLYEIERAIDVNVKAQKTPILVVCDEAERLSLENLYKKYDGNIPVVFGTKSLDLKNIQALGPQAPFVADKLESLKHAIWNEALTFFGIENTNTEKKEHLITDEVSGEMGDVFAQRSVMLNARREAAEKINRMFGTNISVDFRSERPNTPLNPTGQGSYSEENDDEGEAESYG